MEIKNAADQDRAYKAEFPELPMQWKNYGYEKIAIESISSNPEHIGGNSQHTSFCGRNPHLP